MSNPITIQLDQNKTSFRPGEAIRGSVAWELAEIPRSIEVRLVWSTGGMGRQDIEIVETVAIQPSKNLDKQNFELHAPPSPYSYQGKLSSLIWAVEAVIAHSSASMRQEIVISPTGSAIDLYQDKPTGGFPVVPVSR